MANPTSILDLSLSPGDLTCQGSNDNHKEISRGLTATTAALDNGCILSQLPVFLVDVILSFLGNRKNVCAFASTSREFRSLIRSDLFKHIWEGNFDRFACRNISANKKSTTSCNSTAASEWDHCASSNNVWRLGNSSLDDLQYSIGMCIDDYCPLCPLKRVKGKNCRTSCLRALAAFPFRKLHLHCFVGDIPQVLTALSARRTISELHVRLTNKSNSPPLHQVLMQHPNLMAIFEENSKSVSSTTGSASSPSPSSLLLPELTSLCIDSSLLQHVNLLGRALLIGIIGKSLTSLSLVGHSPYGLFALLSANGTSSMNNCCPNLLHLQADNISSEDDFLSYSNYKLQSLTLYRPSFSLSTVETLSSQFPNLRYLRYTPSSILGEGQVHRAMCNVLSVTTLVKLYFEFPSSLIEEALLAFCSANNHVNHQLAVSNVDGQRVLHDYYHSSALNYNQIFEGASISDSSDCVEDEISDTVNSLDRALRIALSDCSTHTQFNPRNRSRSRGLSAELHQLSSGSASATTTRSTNSPAMISPRSTSNSGKDEEVASSSSSSDGLTVIVESTGQTLSPAQSPSQPQRPPMLQASPLILPPPAPQYTNQPPQQKQQQRQSNSRLTDLVLVGSINNVGVISCRAIQALGQFCGQTLCRLSLICSKSIFHLTLTPSTWMLMLCIQRVPVVRSPQGQEEFGHHQSSQRFIDLNIFPSLESLTIMHCKDNRSSLSVAMERISASLSLNDSTPSNSFNENGNRDPDDSNFADANASAAIVLPRYAHSEKPIKVPLLVTFLECKKSMNKSQWSQLQADVPRQYETLQTLNVSVEVKDMIDC